LNKRFVEYPDTRPYFRAGKPLPESDSERQRILAIADIYLDFIDNFYVQDSVANHMQETMQETGGDGFLIFNTTFDRRYVMEVCDGLVPKTGEGA
jgi:hypothetical protein